MAPASSAVAAGCAERDVMPPSDAEIKSLGDAAPSTPIHQLTLKYDFEVKGEEEKELRESRLRWSAWFRSLSIKSCSFVTRGGLGHLGGLSSVSRSSI